MKVLVTGATGFLGGYIVDLLADAGHDIRALARVTSKTGLLEGLGAEIVRGDLTDDASLARAVEGVDAVIHAAATMSGPPQEFEAATVAGTRSLLDAAEKAGVTRFVHVSSIGILSAARRSRRNPVTEETAYESNPVFLGVYNKSKMAAEETAIEYARHGKMTVLVVRPGLLYGPRGKWVLPRMGYALGKNCFALVGMGHNCLPVAFVRDCARAVLFAMEKDGPESGAIFNIVDDEPLKQIEYLKRLRRDVRPKLKIVRVPYPLARLFGLFVGIGMKFLKRGNPIATAHLVNCVRPLRYSNRKAKELLGWVPEADKEQYLCETMRCLAESERISRRADIRSLGRPEKPQPSVTAAIVGCGVIADSHLGILRETDHARPVAVCDLNRGMAQELAQRHKILHVYDNLDEMLRTERPQIVHVLTPPQSHAEIACMALERGAHVLVEKPMGLTCEDARRMAQTAKRCGKHLCVDHNHCYDPIMVRARRLIESGAVGDVIWVESYYGFVLGSNRNTRYMLPGAGAHWTFKIPGGLYQNLAPHPVSVALDVLGDVTSVRAQADQSRVVPHQPSDELRIFLETTAGAGMVTVSLAASPRFQYIDIHGTKMRVKVDLLNKWLITESVGKGIPKPISRAMMNCRHGKTVLRGTLGGMVKVLRRKWTPYDGMAVLIKEFYAAVQDGREPPVTAEEGLAVMEVMDETWRQIGPLGDTKLP